MNKSERDKYWTELIQTCRVSGLSDYEWCRMHHISTSSFYYNVKRLRMAACNNAATVVPVHEKQEVVPIHYNELKDNNYPIPNCSDDKSDIRIEFNGYSIAINNSADSRIIAAFAKAVNYTLNQKPYMENYLKDGRCSISNNAAERAVKAYVMGRKNFLFHDTVKGATASAIVYTLAETAKVNGLNIRLYLETVMTKMLDYKNEPESILEDLMPWSKMMQETCNLNKHSEI